MRIKCSGRIFSRAWRPNRSDRLKLQSRVILRTKRAYIQTGYVARLPSNRNLPIQSLTLTTYQHQIRISLL